MLAMHCLTLTLPSPSITFSLCHWGPSGSLLASSTKQVLQIHVPCPTQYRSDVLLPIHWKHTAENDWGGIIPAWNWRIYFLPMLVVKNRSRKNAGFGLGRAQCSAALGNKRPWLTNMCFWGTSNNPQQGFHWLPVSHTGNINPTKPLTAQHL